MRGDLDSRRLAQLVCELFGECLDGRFGCVVCGVTRRVRDALLRARVDDNGARKEFDKLRIWCLTWGLTDSPGVS